MAQNTIYLNRNNPVAIEFTFSVPSIPTFGLLSFDEIVVSFAGTTYSSITNTDEVKVVSNTLLELYLGLEITEETIPTYLNIVGINSTYPEGYILSSKCAKNLSIPKVCN